MNPVAWSISAEFFFYLAFPWLSRVRNLTPGLIASIAATILILLVAEIYNPSLAEPASPWGYSPAAFVLQSPLIRVAEFIAGVWFAKIYDSRKLERFIVRFATPLEVSCVALILIYGAMNTEIVVSMIALGHPLIGVWLHNSAGMFFFGALIFVVAHQAGAISRILQSRILVLLGETSFSLYMIHDIIISYMRVDNVLADHAWWIRAAVATSTAYFGSYLLWRFIEVPARKLILRRSTGFATATR